MISSAPITYKLISPTYVGNRHCVVYSLIDDKNGFRVSIKFTDDESIVMVRFDKSIAYQRKTESDIFFEIDLASGITGSGIYEVSGSTFFDNMKKMSIRPLSLAKQYSILASDDVVDVIAFDEPSFEKI